MQYQIVNFPPPSSHRFGRVRICRGPHVLQIREPPPSVVAMPRTRKQAHSIYIYTLLKATMAMSPLLLPSPPLTLHHHRHRQYSAPMDMKRLRRHPSSNSDDEDGGGGALSVPSDRKSAAGLVRLIGFGATCLLLLPVLLLYFRISPLNGAGGAAYRLGFHPSPPKGFFLSMPLFVVHLRVLFVFSSCCCLLLS